MTLAIEFGDTRELRDMARDLARAAPRLERELRRALWFEGELIKLDVQARALAIPSHGTKHTGLRAALANAVEVTHAPQTRSPSVRIEVDVGRMPPTQYPMPASMELRRGWNHQVYGQPRVIVHQQGHPYFWPAVRDHLPSVRWALDRTVSETNTAVNRGNV